MLMRILRMLAGMAAGVWLGAMILIAIVAQTTFATMRTTGVDEPNSVAGQVMARNFSKFDIIQMVCASIVLLWQIAAWFGGARSLMHRVRFIAVAVAFCLACYSATVLTPRIAGMGQQLSVSDIEAKAIFDDFHHSAVRLSQINLILVAFIAGTLAWAGANRTTVGSHSSGFPLANS